MDDPIRIEKLKDIWWKNGPSASKVLCRRVSEALAVEEIDYNFYRGSAQALVSEMDGNQDPYYMEEKLRQLVHMFAIAYRHTPDAERFEKAYKALLEYP